MENTNNKPEDLDRKVDLVGNPVAILDSILGCCHMLLPLFEPSVADAKSEAAQLFHMTNASYIEAVALGKSDETNVSLDKDWDKLREIYGEGDWEDENSSFLRKSHHVSKLNQIFLKTQMILIRFIIQSFADGFHSKRGQIAVLEACVSNLLESDIQSVIPNEQHGHMPRRQFRNLLTQSPDLVLQKLGSKVDFFELAIDYLSDVEIDTSNSFRCLMTTSETCSEYRRFILKIVPVSICNEMTSEEYGIVAMCDSLCNNIHQEIFDRVDHDSIDVDEIESLIKVTKLPAGESLLEIIPTLEFESKVIGEQIQPVITELKLAYSSNMNSTVVFLCANLVENLLMEIMERNKEQVWGIIDKKNLNFRAQNPFIKKDDFTTWGLHHLLIMVKHLCGSSRPEYYNVLEAFRRVRNSIHGGNAPLEKLHSDLAMNALAVCEQLISKGV